MIYKIKAHLNIWNGEEQICKDRIKNVFIQEEEDLNEEKVFLQLVQINRPRLRTNTLKSVKMKLSQTEIIYSMKFEKDKKCTHAEFTIFRNEVEELTIERI